MAYLDELISLFANFVFLRLFHVGYPRDDAVNVPSSGLDLDAVGPSDLEVADGTPVRFADVQKPVENVVVVFGIEDNAVGTVEDRGGFGVDDPARSEESGVGGSFAICITVIHQANLTRIRYPMFGGTVGVVVDGFSGEAEKLALGLCKDEAVDDETHFGADIQQRWLCLA